jgi:hypothetical protein
MYLSLYVHYYNKYPGGYVAMTDDELDVFDKNDNHVVAMRKNGAGQWMCISEILGLSDRHDLAPIPKEARLYKMKDGKFCKDEHYHERVEKMGAFLCDDKRRIKSCDELKKSSPRDWDFDERQRTLKKPEVSEALMLEAPKPDDILDAKFKDLLKENELVKVI